MDLTEYSNKLVPSWGWWPVITSKAAWDKASGGDVEKGKEWARSNIVGTGPFMLREFKRDVHIKWVKNPNYWRPGRPYLDGIEVRYIPDTVTASSMLQVGEAITGTLMRLITDTSVVIPVYDPPAATMQKPYVHSTQYEQGFVRWQTEEIWMGKH